MYAIRSYYDKALAARFRRLQTEQADNVAGIGVVLELAVRLVVAHVRVGDIETEILDVAEQMSFRVLRARHAEMAAESYNFV